MQRTQEVATMAELSCELTKELDSVADRAFQLSKQLNALHETTRKTTYSEKGIQADFGPTSSIYKLDRAKRLNAFSFHSGVPSKLNWPRIRALSVERLIEETDTRSLMDLFNDLAYADLEAESGYNLTESNLIKLIQLCQLLMQFMQWNVEQGSHACQLLQEERSALVHGMKIIPDMSIKEVDDGLVKLGKDYMRVADADLDAMFIQVRTEERVAAHDMITGAVDMAKKEIMGRTSTLPTLDGVSRTGDTARRDQGVQHGLHIHVVGDENTPPAAASAAVAAVLAAAGSKPAFPASLVDIPVGRDRGGGRAGQEGDQLGRSQRGVHVYVAGEGDTTSAMATAAAAAALAAAGAGPAGVGGAGTGLRAGGRGGRTSDSLASTMGASQGMHSPSRLGGTVGMSGAMGTGSLTRSEAYRGAFKDIPAATRTDGERTRDEAALVSARLSAVRHGPYGQALPNSLFPDDDATSLKDHVRYKQAEAAAQGGWDAGADVTGRPDTGLPDGAPVQPMGLMSAMAAYDAQRPQVAEDLPKKPHWAAAAHGRSYSQLASDQQQGAAGDPFSFVPTYTPSPGLITTVRTVDEADPLPQEMGWAKRGPATPAAWSEATHQALARPGLALAPPMGQQPPYVQQMPLTTAQPPGLPLPMQSQSPQAVMRRSQR